MTAASILCLFYFSRLQMPAGGACLALERQTLGEFRFNFVQYVMHQFANLVGYVSLCVMQSNFMTD